MIAPRAACLEHGGVYRGDGTRCGNDICRPGLIRQQPLTTEDVTAFVEGLLEQTIDLNMDGTSDLADLELLFDQAGF